MMPASSRARGRVSVDTWQGARPIAGRTDECRQSASAPLEHRHLQGVQAAAASLSRLTGRRFRVPLVFNQLREARTQARQATWLMIPRDLRVT